VAIELYNIGSVWRILGHYQKAIEYYNKALEIKTRFFGEEHPTVAAAWYALGDTWLELGDYQKAVEYLEKALTVREQVLGGQHPKSKKTKEKLAFVRQKTGYWPARDLPG
jgi:tetratricopeptide (TPR) repeat protein